MAQLASSGPSEVFDMGARRLTMTRRETWLLGSVYGYWLLFVASWWLWLSSNHNESWFDAFSIVAQVLFLPLALVTFALCRLAWGSLDIFQAHPVVGLLEDVTVASFLVVSAFALVAVLWRSRVATQRQLSG
jgi:hypothetical protein